MFLTDSYGFPAWFFEPASVQSPGSLGFANPSLQGTKHSELLAKCRALKGYCELERLDCKVECKQMVSAASLEKVIKSKVEGLGLKFDTATLSFPMYPGISVVAAHAYKTPLKTYAFFEDSKVCSLDLCKPGYLCSPGLEGFAGALGYSRMSLNFFTQYALALKRAVEMFAYLYQVDVDVKELRKILRTSTSAFRLRLKSAKVLPSGSLEEIRLMVRGLCVDSEGGLFVYLISPDIPEKGSKEEPCWIEDPLCTGEYVAVGVAGPNLNGLYEQIKTAIVRALVELAKQKGILLSEELVKKSLKGSFVNFKLVTRRVETRTKEVVSAKLVGIYKKDGLIYAGVVEVKR